MHIYCFSNDFLSLKNMSKELKELSGKGKRGEGKKECKNGTKSFRASYLKFPLLGTKFLKADKAVGYLSQ